MKYLLFLVSLLILQQADAQITIKDPNAQIRQVAAFQSIQISGGIDLMLTKSNQQAVVVSSSSGTNDKILTEVRDGILYISVDNRIGRLTSRNKFNAYISYTDLKAINASGASNVKFAEPVQLERLSVGLSGASTLKGTLNVTRLSIELKGASEAIAGGEVDELDVICSGASDLKAYQLKTKKADIKTSGASDVNITVSDILTVNASGASDVNYRGNPKTSVTATGASSVKQKN